MYVVEKHAIERIPSALMLRSQSASAGDGPFLGVADGIYNVADPRWKPASSDLRWFGFRVPGRKARPTFELARLAGSSREINSCARSWQGSRPPMLLTGWQASREDLKTNLRNRPTVVHLAAHVLSPKDPKDAVIDFGLSRQGQPEMLTYSDIGNLDVQGATVIVNGCSSGDGGAGFSQGVMGLTRAWLMAGAQTVVGTRWPIPDDAGDLFQSFYLSWKNGRSSSPGKRIVARSLQQAQLTALHGNTWRSNPKYWGAFYVVGKE